MTRQWRLARSLCRQNEKPQSRSLPLATTAVLLVLALLLQTASGLTVPSSSLDQLTTTLVGETSSWRFLYQNNGDWSDNRQTGYLLSGKETTRSGAAAVCVSMHETLAPVTDPVDAGLQRQLAYLVYDGSYKAGQQFWVANGKAVTISSSGKAKEATATPKSSTKLPVICTQSAPRTAANETVTSAKYQVATGDFVGYRDGRSFRFGGVPYALPRMRFEQSSVHKTRSIFDALLTDRSKQCPQTAGTDKPYTEDCLLLNVYTPTIGAAQAKTGRPIMVWVHGGGFTSGSGLDFTFDGGELASRGDVVVVTVNYRLGSLGFLSINDEAPGNYGVNDVITALKWVQGSAALFGGDATRVMLFGQSAGAQIIEALLGSPEAEGLFSSAIVQSGRPQDRANALQTTAAAQAGTSGDVIKALGCDGASDKLACLRRVPTNKFLEVDQFAKPVVDGKYITGDVLDVAGKRRGHINKVPVIFGFMRDETASLGYVPPPDSTLDAALAASGLSNEQQQAVKDHLTLFPSNDVINTTVTAATDATSIKRCGQESNLLAAAQSKKFAAVYGYIQDQRAYQIPNYDPNGVCQSSDPTAPYYFCHSGDLLPTFGSAGYAYHLGPRDQGDIIWTSLMMDQWSSFARTGKPTPNAKYLAVRGYQSTIDALERQDGKWLQVLPSSSTARIMSLGPEQRMVSLRQNGEQCDVLKLPIDYISQGG